MKKHSNGRILAMVMGAVVIMVAASFGFVPLYDLFCRVTGFDGTPSVSQRGPGVIIDRTINVKFDANVSPDLPWKFVPEQRDITLKLGEVQVIRYKATNESGQISGGTALYNITPPKAGKYFHKVECFCFGEQILKSGESAYLPVSFYIDPEMDKDPNLADLKTITLSYSFFPINSSALDKALEDFYNTPAADAVKK